MNMVKEIAEESETQLVNTIKTTLQTLPPLPTDYCICRVPYILRQENEEAYTPMMISFGPFHHGKASLKETEVHKQRYLNDFLKRRPDLGLEFYVRTIKEFENVARDCYTENIHYSSNDFLRMMLLDGCFIVEFVLKLINPGKRNKDDPIFKNAHTHFGIRRDMVLLENQLPFFILEHLFNSSDVPLTPECYFTEIICMLMHVFIGEVDQSAFCGKSTYQANHIIDVLLQCYSPTGTRTKLSPTTDPSIRIPNASRLQESGVQFRQSAGLKCFVNVKFENGNLEIPTLKLVDDTEAFLRNLVAFEQCDDGNAQYISEYILLLDFLIDTPDDVELLKKAGIIHSFLGDNEEVSKLFNKLCTRVTVSSQYLHGVLEGVNDHCKKRRNVWRAKLNRDYFNSPWTIISVIAAAILLILAFIQTICSVFQL